MKSILSLLFITILFFSNNNPVFSQWQQTNGPGGGMASCFAGNDSFMFAGTSSGVYSSTNEGNMWKFRGLSGKNVRAILYTDTILIAGTAFDGAYRSSDNGYSWMNVDSSLASRYINGLTKIDTIVFAATNDGIFSSNDNAVSWSSVYPSDNSHRISSIAVLDTIIFAAVQNVGVVRSFDSGMRWDTVSGLPYSVISFCKQDTVFIAGGSSGAIYRSTDWGNSWTTISGAVQNLDVHSITFFAGSLVAAASNSLNSSGMYHSRDYGLSWDTISFDLTGRVPIAVSLYKNMLYAGTRNMGVFRSTDLGENWCQINRGLTNVEIYRMQMNGSVVEVSDYYHLFRSTDNGFSWNDTLERWEVEQNIDAFASTGRTIFIGADNRVIRTVNGGIVWEIVIPQIDEVSTIIISGTDIYVSSLTGVQRSQNTGATWMNISNEISNSDVEELFLCNTTLFAQTALGLYRSTDQGTHWGTVPDWPFNEWATAMIAHGNLLFAGAESSGVLYSDDNGETWNPVNSGLTNLNIRALAQSRTSIFVATNDGVFLSSDSGATWSSINEGLMDNDITTLGCNDQYLFAGTYSNGVWKRHLSEIKSVENYRSERLPQEFFLEQNYPNPFNPLTVIRYQLPVKSAVSLKVFDVLGREVATLVDEKKEVGEHLVRWDAEGVSSGVYYYKLSTDTYSETKKLVIIK